MYKSGTLAAVHSPKCLNIRSISDIYRESRSIAYATSRVKADNAVKTALECKHSHEQQWKSKFSISVNAENAHTDATKSIQDNVPTPPGSKYLEKVKDNIKSKIKQDVNRYWANHVKNLVVQGRFLDLLYDENNTITWQSIIYNLPQGILQFITNASIDTLSTNENLITQKVPSAVPMKRYAMFSATVIQN